MKRSIAVDIVFAVVTLDYRTWMPKVSLRLVGHGSGESFLCAISMRFSCNNMPSTLCSPNTTRRTLEHKVTCAVLELV